MKKLLLHILLMCQAVVLFKPVLPFLSDFVSHAFFYTQHMATVHYENGKYHVHYQTAKDVKEEKQDKNTPASQKDKSTSEYIVTTTQQAAFVILALKDEYATAASPQILSGVVQNNFPPPRF
jgi:hypothetical protein